MASLENNDMSLVEMDLDVFEVDVALLRELLEEEQDIKDESYDQGYVECVVESLEGKGSNYNLNIMERKEEQQEQNCLEQHECHSVHDFEWLNMIDMMEQSLYETENWFSNDIVGMVDFGYANTECFSQICDGLASSEVSYGCFWETCDI